jgi:hypothetical protein
VILGRYRGTDMMAATIARMIPRDGLTVAEYSRRHQYDQISAELHISPGLPGTEI